MASPDDQPELSKRAPGISVIQRRQPVNRVVKSDTDDKTADDASATDEYQLVTKAYIGMVAVAGVLEADVRAGEDAKPDDYEYAPVYRINDAQLVEEAWTRF